MAKKIKTSDIAPELRGRARLIRLVLPYYSVGALRLFSHVNRVLRGAHGPGLSYRQVQISGPSGALRLCVYGPKEPVGPGLLWIHGGGYALGVPEQDEAFLHPLVKKLGFTVIAPDYRLSTKAPYPAALEDCYAALLWMKENAGQLGINPDQLMVGGDSAGGGLTAALCIYARDKGEVSVAFQMPLYPMLDDRPTESSRDNDAPVWNTKSNENAWKLYLGELYGREDVPVYAAPGRLEDFSGLPPAWTFIGSVEPFLDETIRYMEGLKAAGIPANYRVYPGCFHGFDILGGRTEVARQARQYMLEGFTWAKESCFAPNRQDTP